MSIATAIAAKQQQVAAAYTACSSKGATMPTTQDLSNLPTAINSISGGSGTKYGVSIDNFLGDVINGYYIKNTEPFDFALPFVSELNVEEAFYYKFYKSTLRTATLNISVINVQATRAFEKAFSNCSNLIYINFPSLSAVAAAGAFYQMCYFCSNLAGAYFPSLKTIGINTSAMSSQQFSYAFAGTKITSLSFPKLTTIYCTGPSNFYGTFSSNSTIQKMYFPELTKITYGSGASASNQEGCKYIFYGCSKLTEIHFGAANESAIKATAGYSTLWGRGAGNATVYFDL